MSVLITLITLITLLTPPPLSSYDDIVDIAINNCPTKHKDDISMDVINDLITVEDEYFKRYNIPEKLRGMVLAAACSESGFNPTARGDWTPNRRRARAIGILQLWPWWENSKHGYGVIRTNHIDSANAWFTHIIKQLPKVDRRCRYKSVTKRYVAAWVHAIRAPRRGGRCREIPRHYRLLQRWNRILKHRECSC